VNKVERWRRLGGGEEVETFLESSSLNFFFLKYEPE